MNYTSGVTLHVQSCANYVETFFDLSQIRVQGHHSCFYNTEAHLKLYDQQIALFTVKGKTNPSYIVCMVTKTIIRVFYLISAILHGKIS